MSIDANTLYTLCNISSIYVLKSISGYRLKKKKKSKRNEKKDMKHKKKRERCMVSSLHQVRSNACQIIAFPFQVLIFNYHLCIICFKVEPM